MNWPALLGQFGAGIKALRLAMAVYPEVHVEVDEDRGGIVMHPSAPAVPKQAGRRALGQV